MDDSLDDDATPHKLIAKFLDIKKNVPETPYPMFIDPVNMKRSTRKKSAYRKKSSVSNVTPRTLVGKVLLEKSARKSSFFNLDAESDMLLKLEAQKPIKKRELRSTSVMSDAGFSVSTVPLRSEKETSLSSFSASIPPLRSETETSASTSTVDVSNKRYSPHKKEKTSEHLQVNKEKPVEQSAKEEELQFSSESSDEGSPAVYVNYAPDDPKLDRKSLFSSKNLSNSSVQVSLPVIEKIRPAGSPVKSTKNQSQAASDYATTDIANEQVREDDIMQKSPSTISNVSTNSRKTLKSSAKKNKKIEHDNGSPRLNDDMFDVEPEGNYEEFIKQASEKLLNSTQFSKSAARKKRQNTINSISNECDFVKDKYEISQRSHGNKTGSLLDNKMQIVEDLSPSKTVKSGSQKKRQRSIVGSVDDDLYSNELEYVNAKSQTLQKSDAKVAASSSANKTQTVENLSSGESTRSSSRKKKHSAGSFVNYDVHSDEPEYDNDKYQTLQRSYRKETINLSTNQARIVEQLSSSENMRSVAQKKQLQSASRPLIKDVRNNESEYLSDKSRISQMSPYRKKSASSSGNKRLSRQSFLPSESSTEDEMEPEEIPKKFPNVTRALNSKANSTSKKRISTLGPSASKESNSVKRKLPLKEPSDESSDESKIKPELKQQRLSSSFVKRSDLEKAVDSVHKRRRKSLRRLSSSDENIQEVKSGARHSGKINMEIVNIHETPSVLTKAHYSEQVSESVNKGKRNASQLSTASAKRSELELFRMISPKIHDKSPRSVQRASDQAHALTSFTKKGNTGKNSGNSTPEGSFTSMVSNRTFDSLEKLKSVIKQRSPRSAQKAPDHESALTSVARKRNASKNSGYITPEGSFSSMVSNRTFDSLEKLKSVIKQLTTPTKSASSAPDTSSDEDISSILKHNEQVSSKDSRDASLVGKNSPSNTKGFRNSSVQQDAISSPYENSRIRISLQRRNDTVATEGKRRSIVPAVNNPVVQSVVQALNLNNIGVESESSDEKSSDSDNDSVAEVVENDLLQSKRDRTPQSTKKRKPRQRRKDKDGGVPTMPRSFVHDLVSHFAEMPVTSDAVSVINRCSQEFWPQVLSTLMAYADHAGRNSIEKADCDLYLYRLRYIHDKNSLNALIEKYLPLELRNEVIPMAKAVFEAVP